MSAAIATSRIRMSGESSATSAAATIRSRTRFAMTRASHQRRACTACRTPLPGGGRLRCLCCLRLLGPGGHLPGSGAPLDVELQLVAVSLDLHLVARLDLAAQHH